MSTIARRRLRYIAAVSCLALVAAACSDSSGSAAPETTLVRASTTTTLVPDTPLQDGSDQTDNSSSSTTAAPVVVGFLPVSVVFPEISAIDPTLSLRALAPGDIDRLESRFRQDERVDVFLEEVDARGVYQGEELVAVAVAVAVTPGAASTSGFTESFVSGATDGGIVNPQPVEVLDQELTSWLAADTGHLLWSFENLFLIVSGRDPILVRTISEAIVTMVLAPPAPPQEVECPGDVEVDPAEQNNAESTTTTTESATVVTGEDGEPVEEPVVDCVPAAVDGETTTTTEG